MNVVQWDVELRNKVDKCAVNFHIRQALCGVEDLPTGRHGLSVIVCTGMNAPPAVITGTMPRSV